MNLISLIDWTRENLEGIIASAVHIKQHPEHYNHALAGSILLMIFEKPSLRTRVSFESAMLQMGGHSIYYDLGMSPLGSGKETIADTARTASRYVQGIMARMFRRADMEELGRYARVPVINGLTDHEHPCQALGDLLTIQERKGALQGLRLAYVGEGNNNVTHSLLHACSKMGMQMTVGCPADPAYQPLPEVLAQAESFAQESGGSIAIVYDAQSAVANADVVYTDTWMSYHIPEEEHEKRFHMLEPFRVTEALMQQASPNAIFMHCLPAQRGNEQTAEVIDGSQSVVFDQAENRLHIEKAILVKLLGAKISQ
ncbi:MAG: ornithine carbamoyltransferase [Nitrospirota bacterium]|nr:ornithine carbamoyltransferase [Nitrospirota bacterium]MDH5773762.1 ornithine carbamoyltransferase [Nitrospirota bacterium]